MPIISLFLVYFCLVVMLLLLQVSFISLHITLDNSLPHLRYWIEISFVSSLPLRAAILITENWNLNLEFLRLPRETITQFDAPMTYRIQNSRKNVMWKLVNLQVICKRWSLGCPGNRVTREGQIILVVTSL